MSQNLSAQLQHTRILFNHPVDKRYAWLGNDAEVANFQTEIVNLINSATTSIEVSTMTFTKPEIASALVTKSNSGVPVRVIGNGGHRLKQDGWRQTLQGRLVDMVDNNLPALVYRINFQSDIAPAPAGWIADRGQTFGNHGASADYGWSTDQITHMHSAGMYQSPLLDDCYTRNNADGVQTWEIAVPNGPYYIALVSGRPDSDTRSYLQVEGRNVLNSGAYLYASKPAGQFWGEPIDGGVEVIPGEDPSANSVRVVVSDGRLTLTIGDNSAPSGTNSAICFLEIYRGDSELSGDTSYDDGVDNTIQERQTMHAKYIIIDAGTPNQKVWFSSGNLTQGMDVVSNNSEDAVISTDPSLVSAFKGMFDQMWGAPSGPPVPSNSNFGTYKTSTSFDFTIDGYAWKLRFSPSKGTVDMADVVKDHINASSKDLTLIMEQFKSNPGIRGFDGTNTIITTINTKLIGAYRLRGLISDNSGVNNGSFTTGFSTILTPSGSPTEMKIHNKYALTDALRDSRYTHNGKVLFGSMNWTQSALHFNDEQTLVVQNPFIANMYLQHAMKRLQERGIAPAFQTDIVLVLDRSFSMNDPSAVSGISKLEAAKAAADLFLDIIDSDGSHRLSLVRFGNIIEPFAPPISLNSYNNGQRIACHAGVASTFATLPIGNATCYNVALDEVIGQMDAVATPNERRLVHFFTDGKENCAIHSNTFYTALQARGIEVHSTGFGAGTDMAASLEGLATATGGTYAQVELDPLSLKKRFAEVARNAMNLSTVLDPTYMLKANGSVKTSFFLDPSTTRLKVIASWSRNLKKPYSQFYLIAPDGTVVDKPQIGIDWNFGNGYIVISIDGKSRLNISGTWKVIFVRTKEPDRSVLPLDLIVFADGDLFFKAEYVQTDRTKGLYTVMCRMLYKNEPVTNLKVTTAIKQPIEQENDKPIFNTIKLADNGKKCDTRKGDGLFTNTMQTKSIGNYQLHVIAEGTIQIEGKKEKVRREAVVNILR